MNKKFALSLLFALILAACGGGGDGDSKDEDQSPPPDTTPINPVTQASRNTVSQLGLTMIPGNEGNVQVYDLTADVGDTWRLTLNLDTGAYTVQVLQSAYGVSDASGTFTKTSSNYITTLTEATGKFSLELDERTNTLGGTMTLSDSRPFGSRSASVMGTRYAMPVDLSVLAGNYVFTMATRQIRPNGLGGINVGPEVSAPGTLLLRADGTGLVCLASVPTSAGTCNVPGINQPIEGVNVRLDLDPADGEVHLRATQPSSTGFSDFGRARIQAGDRGPVLTFDLPANGNVTPSGSPNGVIYAVKQRELQGNELDGAWVCSNNGDRTARLSAGAGTAFYTEVSNPIPVTFQFNRFDDGYTKLTVDGLAGAVTSTYSGLLVLPLSSSSIVITSVHTSPASTSTYICH